MLHFLFFSSAVSTQLRETRSFCANERVRRHRWLTLQTFSPTMSGNVPPRSRAFFNSPQNCNFITTTTQQERRKKKNPDKEPAQTTCEDVSDGTFGSAEGQTGEHC